MSRSAPRSRNFSAQKFAKCLQFFCIFGAATHQKSAGIVTETARSKRRSWLSRWCVCFRRIRARGSRYARAKFASRKIKLFFSNLNCLNLCRLVAMLANRARKTPVHFPHVRRTKRPTSMRMSRLLCRKMAHSAPRSWNFSAQKFAKLLHFFCVIDAATHSNVGQHRCRN